jgi:hypothetical protein
MANRPVLIDEQDGPCEICREWASHKTTLGKDGKAIYHCDSCGEPIPVLGLMGGRGFDSVRPHHLHLRGIGPSGIPGRAGVHRELCPRCYREDRAEAYPGLDPEPFLDPNGRK